MHLYFEIKIVLFGLFIIFAIVIMILNLIITKRAEKPLEQGDINGALEIYRDLFVGLFESAIEKEGYAHVPSFLRNLKKPGMKHLKRIKTILEENGKTIDISPYEELIVDVEKFSKQKGLFLLEK